MTLTQEPADWWRLTPSATAQRLGVDLLSGLDTAEVAERLERFGGNELDDAPRRPAWKRFIDQFRNLMVYILLGAAVVSLAVGDIKDPIVIGIVLLINAIMGFVQENRADNALAALQGMLETIVRVRRDGQVSEVAASGLVPGDVVLLEAGDRVPADGRFVMTASTSVDESMLTGESVPSEKQDEVIPGDGDVPLADRVNLGFMNTTLVRGRAELVVTSTGMSTEVGRLAGLLGAAEDKPTPLQEQIDALGKRLALIAFVAVLAVFVVALLQAPTLDGDAVSEALINSVALAVAAIPEGLPAVVTVTLAIGVSRMARRHAIVKRLASVETLGSTSVICSDKTGTLTLNQMTATALSTRGRRFAVEGLGYGTEGAITSNGEPVSAEELAVVRPALLAGVLCNDAHLRTEDGRPSLVGDPTEGALVVLGAKGGVDPAEVRRRLARVAEVPFDSSSKFMATLHPHPDDPARSLVVVKGAPDVVIQRCATVADGGRPRSARRRSHGSAGGGERVARFRGAACAGAGHPRVARGRARTTRASSRPSSTACSSRRWWASWTLPDPRRSPRSRSAASRASGSG